MPDRRFVWFMGLRYGFGGRNNDLVSFLSRLSMLGLVVGIGLLVTVLSVMNGFDREMRQRILGLMPHVTLTPVSGAADWRKLSEELVRRPGVAGVAPFARFNLMLVSGREVAAGAAVVVSPQHERGAFILHRFLDPTLLQVADPLVPPVALGKALADKLALQVGDRVSLGIPRSRGGDTRIAFQQSRVAAVVDTGTELDQALVLFSLESMAAMPGGGPRIGVKLALTDLFNAPSEAWELGAVYVDQWRASDWTQQLGNLYHAIQMSRRLVTVLLLSVIAVAMFNVVSTLVMVVNDKQRDIAVLRSQGATPGAILRIFLVYGACIGFVGVIAGGALGCFLSLVIGDVVRGLESLFQLQLLNSDVYPITYLPSALRWQDVAGVCGIAWLMSMLATLYPAFRAAGVNPAEALRFH